MCDCISTVNSKLKDAGHNAIIKTPLTLNGPTRTMVVTEKLDKERRKKPVDVFSSFCPFCGFGIWIETTDNKPSPEQVKQVLGWHKNWGFELITLSSSGRLSIGLNDDEATRWRLLPADPLNT